MLGRWYSRLAFSLEFLAFKMFTVASGKGVWRFVSAGLSLVLCWSWKSLSIPGYVRR